MLASRSGNCFSSLPSWALWYWDDGSSGARRSRDPHGRGVWRPTALAVSRPSGWCNASQVFEMKKLLAFAAIAEAATGLALIVVPLLVAQLLLGVQFSGVAIIAGRVAGIALIALGVACWRYGTEARAVCDILSYSALVTLYLLYVAMGGEWVGPL